MSSNYVHSKFQYQPIIGYLLEYQGKIIRSLIFVDLVWPVHSGEAIAAFSKQTSLSENAVIASPYQQVSAASLSAGWYICVLSLDN